MIKKISAIVLALVLCLSVVVMPASAIELADGMNIAYELKWDKEYYSAGETATLNIYMNVADDLQIGNGSLIIGLNSSVITQDNNAPADVLANSVSCDLWNSYYKGLGNASTQASVAWLATTIAPRVQALNTEAENALYDHYFKITIAKMATNDYGADNKSGLVGSDINAVDGPIMSLSFVVADDLADGTAINAGVTSGSLTCSPKQTTYKYYKNPGAATTTADVDAATFDLSAAKATATVGKATPDLTIVKDKTQINFDVDGNKLYEGKFAIRQFVEFDNLLDVFGTLAEAKDGADGTGLTEVGFVYATTDSYNKTDALAVIDAGASSGAYTLDNDAYISTTSKANSFVMGYTVKNIADKSVSLTILAYAKYVVNGKEAIATKEIAGDYSDIYSTYESKIPPVNPEA